MKKVAEFIEGTFIDYKGDKRIVTGKQIGRAHV